MKDFQFDALIVVTPNDCKRLLTLYPRLCDNFSYGRICFIGSFQVGEIVLNNPTLRDRVRWIDENDIISFADVHNCMTKRLGGILNGEELPRGITGWYYQQFLKMQYSLLCQDEYYMVWDGDTVPCKAISMFSKETGQPYLDLKHEYHPEYFETMGKILPGLKKMIERSFISEHMLIRKDIMQNLIKDIEQNEVIEGEAFWEKIINSIEPEKLYDSSFSEFETYGTFVALKYPTVYKLREWHSFRLGGSFFDIDTICDRDFAWLAKDFDAISFEKGQDTSNYHLFDNPEYQQKMSAKKMLQIAQMEYKDGYKEVWEDDVCDIKKVNVREGGYHVSQGYDNKTLIVEVSYNNIFFMQANIESIRRNLTEGTYKIVVVDNASDDGVAQWLEEQDDILLIRNSENVGFGPACNQAVKATIGTEYANWDIFLLNNDTRLIFDALYFLKQALYSSDDIGAVGSISNYAGNKQMVELDLENIDDYIAYGEKVNVPMESPCLERVRLSGFAMLVRRKVWDEIGGFDEDFVPGYFEDDALSMEILKRGYRLKVVRNSFIYHSGSESFVKKDFNSYIKKNYNLFIDKYGFDITRYADANGTIISKIPYGKNDIFSVLHYGCGLGAELKAIKSLFPNSENYGIEDNVRLYEIATATEKIFKNIDELAVNMHHAKFNILIIGKEHFENLNENSSIKLKELLLPDSHIFIKNPYYEIFPYEKIKMIIWGINKSNEQLLKSIEELLKSTADHGMINCIFKSEEDTPICEFSNKDMVAVIDSDEQFKLVLDEMHIISDEVIYIDDNTDGCAEVSEKYGHISTFPSDIIPYLETYCAKTVPKDTDHREFNFFRTVQNKINDRKDESSLEDFLVKSEIHITINRNCLEKISDIYDLVQNDQQLIGGQRWAEKENLTRIICNDWCDCAYIKVRDKYGDYGISGFYGLNIREKKMEYFVFSKKINGMGIETYIYDKLGRPKCTFNSVPKSFGDFKVNWIDEDEDSEIKSDPIKESRPNIFFKGTKYLKKAATYLSGGNLTCEYDSDMNNTKLYAGKYQVICIETGLEYFNQESDILPFGLFEKLDYVYEHVHGSPYIILILSNENEKKNFLIREFVEDHDRMSVISISDYCDPKASGDANLSAIDYYNIAGEICGFINKTV